MKNPKISIIIPMYGVEKYLRRCLDSVLNQTFSDWTAICVDDGSPDKSGEIAEEYAKKDKRFIVVHKENGGLSDARNFGMPYAKGKYIMYLDSDDFIHPQTMEILYFYANKNNADMVSFDFDKKEHKILKQQMLSGINIDNKIPESYYKKYNIKHLLNTGTNKILFHSTEKNHDIGFFRIRHCQVVKNLYKRSLIKDISFIKGIIYEDFPWWSEVMLKHPRTIILQTPLYFYMPNITSILNNSSATRTVLSLCKGILYVYSLYTKKATVAERKYYNKHFLWQFIIIAMRCLRVVDSVVDIKKIRDEFVFLYNKGVFDNPPTLRACKYKHRIQKFISGN